MHQYISAAGQVAIKFCLKHPCRRKGCIRSWVTWVSMVIYTVVAAIETYNGEKQRKIFSETSMSSSVQ